MRNEIHDEVHRHVLSKCAVWVEHRVLGWVFSGCVQNALQSGAPRKWRRFSNHAVVNRSGTKTIQRQCFTSDSLIVMQPAQHLRFTCCLFTVESIICALTNFSLDWQRPQSKCSPQHQPGRLLPCS
jgi:hypothetical protein